MHSQRAHSILAEATEPAPVPGDVRPTRAEGRLRAAALLVVALAVGASTGMATRTLWYVATAAPPPVAAGTGLPGDLQHPVQDGLSRLQKPDQSVAAQLSAAVVLPGDPTPLHGQLLALPAGARFSLALRSSHPGTLQVATMSPDGGRAVELWQQELPAAGEASSPMLRLSGTRGVELLRVTLRAADGHTLAEQTLRIWHL